MAADRRRPIEARVLVGQIREQILDRILDGTLEPGARIVETRIAREMGISQGPVREALRDLVALGLVETQPYRGASVRRLNVGEILDTLSVRTELEAAAGRLAAERCDGSRLGELARLSAGVEDPGGVLTAGALARAEARFRRAVVETVGSPVLLRLWSMLDPLTRVPGLSAAARCRQVVDALGGGDADGAAAAMRGFGEDAVAVVEGRHR